LVGIAVFVAPNRITQLLILVTASASGISMLTFNAGDFYSLIFNYFVVFALALSAIAAIMALSKGGLPNSVGGAPHPELWSRYLAFVLLGTAMAVPVFVILVSGFSVLPGFNEQVTVLPESWIAPMHSSESRLVKGLAQFVEEASRPAGLVLIVAGVLATIYLLQQAFRENKIARERMFVVFVLTFFSVWFWAFFEQSGSSVNNFTDRNIDRVSESSLVAEADVGKTVLFRLVPDESLKDLDYFSQEFLGHENASSKVDGQLERAMRRVEAAKEPSKRMSPEALEAAIAAVISQPRMTMTAMTYLREYAKTTAATPDDKTVEWTFTPENVGKIGLGGTELPASVFQAVNAMYIMIFGLIFTAAWGYLGARGMEPSTPVKFAFGLLQLGLGFAMLYFGAQAADPDGMVASSWLLLMYLLLTTGELCLSPVGLSMITKLSPARLVSTVMGSWFLATAFAQFLAAIIAQFAAVNEGGGNLVPIPAETVHIYGDVYKLVAIMACVAGGICLALSPILKRWMHLSEADAN
jgi:POT family proton-dependent oligopeptide transporter